MTPIEIALKEYATEGIKGIFSNLNVLKYFREIGQKWVTDDDTAWCAAFLNWVLLKAGKPNTGSLLARSFLNYGMSTKSPELGDIVVLWRITKQSPYGHVGLFITQNKDNIYILGGNQNNQVNITAYPKEKLLDFRKIPLVNKTE